MGMPLRKIDALSSAAPEYSVYVFHRHAAEKESANDWEKKRVTTNALRAYKVAEKLRASGQYRKIEVKRKYFDSRNNKPREMTVRLYQGEKKKHSRIKDAAILSAACGFAAFAIACIIING